MDALLSPSPTAGQIAGLLSDEKIKSSLAWKLRATACSEAWTPLPGEGSKLFFVYMGSVRFSQQLLKSLQTLLENRLWRLTRSASLARRSYPAVRIRKATPGDTVAMWQVHTAAVRALRGRVYTHEEIEAWVADDAPETYQRDLRRGRSMFVAEQRGQIIGFSCLFGDEIEALYVHPAHGHNKAGELLLRALEEEARRRGTEKLSLDASMTAVTFYESRGYRVLGSSRPAFDAGLELPCIRMTRTLRSRQYSLVPLARTAVHGHS